MLSRLQEGDIVYITGGLRWHKIPLNTQVKVLSVKYFVDYLRSVYVDFEGKKVFVAGRHIERMQEL
ncbi:hypothetical protein ABD91_21505 [Lysinibacillus sphaericus]|nr:hypothetical protein [Lysinibacillus sphaericus]